MFTRTNNPRDVRPIGVSTGRQPKMTRLSMPTHSLLRELQGRMPGLSFDAIVYVIAMAALAPSEGQQ
jgi:hypothetical protein